MEVACGCADGFIGAWELHSDSDEAAVQMVWRSGPRILTTHDAVIADAVGLSSLNRQLLLQRGANGGSSSVE